MDNKIYDRKHGMPMNGFLCRKAETDNWGTYYLIFNIE